MTLAINGDGVAKDHAELGVSFQYRDCSLDGSWQIQVIRVQPGDDLAASALETFVDGFRLATVFFGYPPGQLIAVLFNDLLAAILGSAIYNAVFDLHLILEQYRTDCILQEIYLIVGRGDDRDKGHGEPAPCAANG